MRFLIIGKRIPSWTAARHHNLAGGSAEAVCHAAAIAIKSLPVLVCDPVAGLVEVPCVKRNAAGVMIVM